VGGAALLAVLVAWTFLISWVYYAFRRRTRWWLAADLVVAVTAIAVTPVVKEHGFSSTLPGFWVIGAMFAWAIHWRLYGGLVAAVLLCVTDVATRRYISASTYGNLFLLLIGGPIVGLMVDSLLRSAARTAAAERAAATALERTRLARAVHDGVLQALAMVQRRGPELGSDGIQLARLAGEQEQALRTLIRQQDAAEAAPGLVDLVAALSALERRPGVTVATPPHVVLLDAARVAEIVAATAAALDNVAAHVGPDAPAWVLVEATPGQVQLSVLDDGPGIPAGRLEEAEREGRLGVSSSIRGRVAELGGQAELTTGPTGTEWELRFPRLPPAAQSWDDD
jgi:signal transduction histidine kinase